MWCKVHRLALYYGAHQLGNPVSFEALARFEHRVLAPTCIVFIVQFGCVPAAFHGDRNSEELTIEDFFFPHAFHQIHRVILQKKYQQMFTNSNVINRYK